MNFEWSVEPETRKLVFAGWVDQIDLGRLRLDHVERAMLRMRHSTPADMLLSLEMIFRRQMEQQFGVPPMAHLIDAEEDTGATEVIKELMAEFRAADLPYGSKAYLRANEYLRGIGA